MTVYIIFALVFWFGAVIAVFPFYREQIKKLLLFPASTHQSHLASLDALRGLAALWIAVFHTWQWPRPAFNSASELAPFIVEGDKAVPIFVTLSGLLIYRSLIKVSDFDQLREYVNRRFLRIFPVYLATVIVSCIAIGPFNTAIPSSQYAISEMFMLRSLGPTLFANPQAWSLYVEVLFYALIPIFVITTRKRPLLWAIIALAVFSFGVAREPRELWLWKYFCFGIIAAEIISRWKMNAHAASLMGVVGIFFIVTGNLHWLGPGVLILIVGAVQSPLFRCVFEIFPLRMLGTISYSLFMWHSFLIVANFPVTFDGKGFLLTIGIIHSVPVWYMLVFVIPALISSATLSYLLIERPFLLKRLNAPKQAEVRV